MNDYNIQEQVDQLKGKIDKRMSHPFLKKHGDMPVMDEERVSMLYRMFRETSLSHEEVDTYIVTVMLVQAALDAHESIDIRKLSDDRAQTSRQLTILGGDYFSGLYYYLLSEIEDILLVRKLAASIQEINEHKMFLYKNNRQNLEETIDSLRIVESSLMRNLADYFEQPVWAAFFEEYFLLRRLLAEKHLYLESKTSSLLHALDHGGKKRGLLLGSRQEKVQQFNHLLDSYIDHARQSVEKLFSNHSRFEHLLGGRIWEMAFKAGAFKQKLAEEG